MKNVKFVVEETVLKISSLEVTSLTALFGLVTSPEAEPFLRGITESSENLETLEQVHPFKVALHKSFLFYVPS